MLFMAAQVTDYTHYLYQALEQPIGICLRTAEVDKAIGILSKTRDAAQDIELKALRICASRHYPTHEVWIIKKRANLPALAKQEEKVDGEGT